MHNERGILPNKNDHHLTHNRYVGVGMPSKEEEKAVAASSSTASPGGAGNGGGGNIGAGDRFGAPAGERSLRVADCSPVRAWAYLLGALPKVRSSRYSTRSSFFSQLLS